MIRRALGPLLWLGLAPALLRAAGLALRPDTWAPRQAADRSTLMVYAYRQWQSTGLDLEQGDQVTLRAAGQWQYSPYVGLHGPEGGGKPVTVDTYPMPGLDGGVLLGRIGDAGEIFYVGRGTTVVAAQAGRLYLRINDDLLGDNMGQLTITASVLSAPTPEPTR